MTITFEGYKQGYTNLWAKMTIDPDKVGVAQSIVTKLIAHRDRYEGVAKVIGCPWWFVAIIHQMEGDANFATHLHNGDPLTARTVNEPPGRPAVGSPPFTWETSAVDALRLKGLDKITDWSIPRCLYEWERYNGWGYIGKENSPYLWADSSLSDEKGKYVRDHVFDANAPTKQCGAAVILRAMMDMKVVPKEEDPMSDLQNFLKPFAAIAPTLVGAIAGPVAGLAVKAIAEALTNEPTINTGTGLVIPDPRVVTDTLEKSPLSAVINVIAAAEQIIRAVQPVAPVAPVVPVPVVVQAPPTETTTTEVASPPSATSPDLMNVFDRLFPALVGWKVYIGGGIYVLASIGALVAPTVITPEVLSIASWVAAFVGGVGIIAKLDRYIAVFKPAVKTTVVTSK